MCIRDRSVSVSQCQSVGGACMFCMVSYCVGHRTATSSAAVIGRRGRRACARLAGLMTDGVVRQNGPLRERSRSRDPPAA
eukprot:12771350-Alexandrium_andersonii.AAC.1